MSRNQYIYSVSKATSIFTPVLRVILLTAVSLSTIAETHLVGERHFKQCTACHLSTGVGVPGMFPSLTERLGPLAGTQKGRDYLVMVVQAGLMGRLSIEGTTYQGMMPAQGPSLGDDGIASVLNYILHTFNADTLAKKSPLFTTVEVAAIKARYSNVSGRDIHALRQSVFSTRK